MFLHAEGKLCTPIDRRRSCSALGVERQTGVEKRELDARQSTSLFAGPSEAFRTRKVIYARTAPIKKDRLRRRVCVPPPPFTSASQKDTRTGHETEQWRCCLWLFSWRTVSLMPHCERAVCVMMRMPKHGLKKQSASAGCVCCAPLAECLECFVCACVCGVVRCIALLLLWTKKERGCGAGYFKEAGRQRERERWRGARAAV